MQDSKRILIIDDSDLTLAAATSALEREGFEVCLNSPIQDAAITVTMTPDGSGWEAVAGTRSDRGKTFSALAEFVRL